MDISVHPVLDRNSWSSRDVQETGHPHDWVSGNIRIGVQHHEYLKLGQERDGVCPVAIEFGMFARDRYI